MGQRLLASGTVQTFEQGWRLADGMPHAPCVVSPCSLAAQIDRRTLLDHLALVLLAVDELVDAGKILEIDPSAIANRVLMRGADARYPQASELTVQQVSMLHAPCSHL